MRRNNETLKTVKNILYFSAVLSVLSLTLRVTIALREKNIRNKENEQGQRRDMKNFHLTLEDYYKVRDTDLDNQKDEVIIKKDDNFLNLHVIMTQ